ncbi:MFS transporter [Dongia sp.]|uniref:MFS transporter n=1 Tax=Dongia sp. TaxID=1977262 RepID=UPI0035AD913A
MPAALYALAAGAFGIGTTEFVIMGLLLEVGNDLGVTIAAAGLLITGYALGVVVGAPLLTVLTGTWPRKKVLLGLMALFTIGNLACALAPDYWSLMAARVVAAFAHGAFFGVGSVVATSLVPAEKKASAIAIMFTGLTAANILGVPFGTWLGQTLDWRATFWAVTAIGLVAMAATALLVPAKDSGQAPRLKDELRAVLQPQVLLGFLMTVLGFGGLFTAFTYIAPILTQVTGLPESWVAPILLLFGLGLIAGNLLGGKLADRALMPALVGTLMALSAVLVAMVWGAHETIPAIIGVALLGAASFATVPPLQMRVLGKAGGAPNLASALNIAAFNLGNAIGAWAGGFAIDQGAGLTSVFWLAALISLGGLAVALISWRLDFRPARIAAACPAE